MVMPAVPVRDVMRRTIANYEFVKAHAGDPDVFEVTQLVNSFLCALIHPWEHQRRQHYPWSLSLAAAGAQGWPLLTCSVGQVSTLGELITVMRNALAHGRVEYLSSNGSDISGLRLQT